MGSARRRRPQRKIRRAAAAMRGHTGARPRDTLVKAAPSRGPSRSLRVGSSPGASRASRSVSAPPHVISSKPSSDAREAWWPPDGHTPEGSALAAPSSSRPRPCRARLVEPRAGIGESARARAARGRRAAARGPTRPNDGRRALRRDAAHCWLRAQVVAGLLGYGNAARRGNASRVRETRHSRCYEVRRRHRVPCRRYIRPPPWRGERLKLVGVPGSFMPPKGCR